MEQNQKIHPKNIEDVLGDGFGRYAKYIIQDRALPNVKDGLKPVQRRIIYGMLNLGIVHNSAYKKSARSVGDIMGKYHPHGDSSIYEAIVRMSQNWKNNLTIIDMQGCNGSIDGDGAAAMRYTESRLTKYAETLAEGINKDCVPFIPNYDGSEKEPTVLPSLIPNLLINGCSGIAAGYATNIPPFNPNEVFDAVIARIDSPNCRIDTIKTIMPGPDFPTGGIIHNLNGIDDCYRTGKGKIIIRAKIELVNKKQAYITQIPFECNKALLIDQIQDLAEKHDVLNITDCHDESDNNGIAICINLRNTDNFNFVKNFLFKNTDAQISYAINMTAICNLKPMTMTILDVLDNFIAHIVEVTTNIANFDLKKALERKEIIDGLIKAIKIIDDVIHTIRYSKTKSEAIENLVKKFLFSQLQADAIVNLRLYRLTNNDVTQLEIELNELNEKIAQYQLIIKDENYRNNYIKAKLREYRKMFDTKRKSVFSNDDATIQIDQNDIIEDRDNFMIVTRDGYLKNIIYRGVQANSYQDLKIKDGDIPVAQFKTNQKNKVLLITSKGNYIVIPIFKIETVKWKDNGIHLNTFVTLEPNEYVVNAINYENNVADPRIIILASKKGNIKRTAIADLSISNFSKSSTIMKLNDNDDEIIGAIVSLKSDEEKNLGVLTITGRGLFYPINQINVIGKNGSGVKNTNANENIAAIFINDQKEYVCIACNRGLKRIHTNEISIGNRTNTPKYLINQIKASPIIVFNSFTVNQNDYINFVGSDKKFCLIKASDVVIGSSDTRVSQINKQDTTFANSQADTMIKSNNLFTN